MINMNCIFCNKKLRKCKRFDLVNRQAHFSCINRELKLQNEYNEFLFCKWLEERIKTHLHLTQTY